MPTKWGIIVMYTKYKMTINGWSKCILYIIHEHTDINHGTRNTVHIFEIYNWKDMAAKLHSYVSLHYYCSEQIDITFVHIKLKNIVSDTNK